LGLCAHFEEEMMNKPSKPVKIPKKPKKRYRLKTPEEQEASRKATRTAYQTWREEMGYAKWD